MTTINYNFNKPYEKILHENLGFIEKQSYLIVKKNFADSFKTGESEKLEIENRSLELSNVVLDTLRKEDFKILKNFNGRAKITTYLTAIISRKFVDIIRGKMGRSREKDRAKEYGDLGLRIYKSVFIEKNSIREFYNIVTHENEKKITLNKIEEIVDKIKGKKKYNKSDLENFPESPVKKGINTSEGEVLVKDKNKTPEFQMISEEKEETINKNLDLILSNLTAEEKFIIKLRFFNEEDDKKKRVETISILLNINKRAVYKRIDRILKKCKKILAKNGINTNDLF